MIKKFMMFATGVLASYAAAATALIWDDQGSKPDIIPASFYTYADGAGAGIDSTNVNGVKVIDFVAPTTTSGKASAGYGLNWKQGGAPNYTPIATSLSSYKGACLTYMAEQPFRVDFKQSTIADYNYYGAELKASATPKKVYLAFGSLTQGWKSEKVVNWSAAVQTGVQFSYKDTHAKASGSSTNAVQLISFVLADECVTAAPNVTEGFKGYNGGAIDLDEGAVHTMNMAEVFEDADGDDLAITVKIESATNSVKLVDSTAYNQNSVIKFTTANNPKGPATVTLTATDPTKKTATFSFTINTIDTENFPVAKNLAFEVLEDSSYRSPVASNNLRSVCSDADGDATVLTLLSEPEHGMLSVVGETGVFIYTPEKDFYGVDYFTYECSEKDKPERKSEIGTATISVKNVNDLPVVKVLTKTFVDADGNERELGDTITVDEDFESFVVKFPKENISISDADGDDDYKVTAKAVGQTAIVTAEISETAEDYLIEVSPVKDANGVTKVCVVVTDPKISIPTVLFYAKVNPVADPPIAKDDEYVVLQGRNEISAKKGVLANDINPDGESKLKAELVMEPMYGTIELNEDGSFVYTTFDDDFLGEDGFLYKVVNEDNEESKTAGVLLEVKYRNKTPVLLVDAADLEATVKEDVGSVTFNLTDVETWCLDPEGQKVTYSFKSADGKTTIQTTKAAVWVNVVKNAFGDAYVDVTATDGESEPLVFQIHVYITPYQDAPSIISRDTIHVKEIAKWKEKIDLTERFEDPDGDSLTYRLVTVPGVLKAELEENILTVTLSSDTVNLGDGYLRLKVRAYDETDSTTATIVFAFDEVTTGIVPQVSATKLNWQGAIQATHGVATMMDLQGRVVWNRRLPVSESEVRAAAASVQGRKILRVNSQSYTIK